MESVKQCHRSVTVKEIGKAPVIAVCTWKKSNDSEEYIYNNRSL